jgi:hypothetical protein
MHCQLWDTVQVCAPVDMALGCLHACQTVAQPFSAHCAGFVSGSAGQCSQFPLS